MLRIHTTLTRKGQVTVPVEIRRALGLKRGDKVVFTMEDGTVRLARTGSVVERTRGVFKSHLPPLTPREMREFAEQAIADEAEERSRR
jgi:AbrB family looped-hinge helix DNA binding protein